MDCPLRTCMRHDLLLFFEPQPASYFQISLILPDGARRVVADAAVRFESPSALAQVHEKDP